MNIISITESKLLATVAYCGVNQDPYNSPRKLDIVLTKLKDIIRKEFPKVLYDFYIRDFTEGELIKWLDNTLKSIPEFEEWNLSKEEYDNGVKVNDDRRGNIMVSRYETPPKDKDFIDLDACIRNIGLILTRLQDW